MLLTPSFGEELYPIHTISFVARLSLSLKKGKKKKKIGPWWKIKHSLTLIKMEWNHLNPSNILLIKKKVWWVFASL